MNVTIELMNASSEPSQPAQQDFQAWTEAAFKVLSHANYLPLNHGEQTEVSIRVIDEEESASLNQHYRQKHGPTNILSFPFASIPGTDITLLGDLAICAPLVTKEAREQNKTAQAHWAHLTVHGVLHLNGFDHEEAEQAQQMEALEVNILNTLGYTNPYQELTGNE